MNNILKKLIYLQLFLIIGAYNLNAQSYNVDYYGVVANELDNNLAEMTSDLYYTKLKETTNITVYDKRTSAVSTVKPDINKISTENYIFYAEVQKIQDSEKWNVIFYLINKNENNQVTKSLTYDSFYKILMDSVSNIINSLFNDNPKSIDSNTTPSAQTPGAVKITTIEELSGTWKGETVIEKIVLSRGGRGFVIYKNGAPMNITVSLENDGETVLIEQKGNSNASFYPELPRNIALDAAINAPPIKWKLSLRDNNTLSGIKTTLVPKDNSFTVGEVPVTWTKVN